MESWSGAWMSHECAQRPRSNSSHFSKSCTTLCLVIWVILTQRAGMSTLRIRRTTAISAESSSRWLLNVVSARKVFSRNRPMLSVIEWGIGSTLSPNWLCFKFFVAVSAGWSIRGTVGSITYHSFLANPLVTHQSRNLIRARKLTAGPDPNWPNWVRCSQVWWLLLGHLYVKHAGRKITTMCFSCGEIAVHVEVRKLDLCYTTRYLFSSDRR